MADGQRTRGGGLTGLLVVVAITVVALVIGMFVVDDGEEAARSDDSSTSAVEVAGAVSAPKVGEPAPGFSGEGLDGAVELSDIDKPTWVLFMATWCTECRAEAPDIQNAFEGRDDVDIVAVYIGEREGTVREYAERVGLTFPQLPNPASDIAASYGVRAIPAHFFVDAEGVVQEVGFGALSETQIAEKLDALVGA